MDRAATIRVYRSLADIGPEAHGCAVSIGNFDGVHAGHSQIFQRVVTVAREHGWTPSVLTFDPHPTKVVAPSRAPKLLTTTSQRIELMAKEGIEQVFVLPFDQTFSEQDPESFAREVLVRVLGAKAVFVGENFRFGNKQAGNIDILRALGEKYGFLVEIVGGIALRGRLVSSSEVRRAVTSGSLSLAGRYLRRPYALDGKVVSGQGIGSTQTVPTLNLATEAEVIPATGVYVSRTTDLSSGHTWNSITNVGFRPTFNGQGLTIETHLLDRLEGAAPDRIRVEFLKRLRGEVKFSDADELKRQILRDVARTQSYFRRLQAISQKIPM